MDRKMSEDEQTETNKHAADKARVFKVETLMTQKT
jgi:hypothetical protein